MKYSPLSLIGGIIGLVLTCGISHAALIINVDFNADGSLQYSGAGVIGSAGDVWNQFGGESATDATLDDSTGTIVPGVTLTFGADRSFDFGSGSSQYNSMVSGAGDLLADFIIEDQALGSGTESSITFEGLAPGSPYSLYVYSGQGVDLSVEGSSTVTISGARSNGGNGFTAGEEYALFTGTADVDGVLNIDYGLASNEKGDISGLQLEIIPEPSAATLLLLGSMGFLLIRRRR